MAGTKLYRVTTDGWLDGKRRSAGDTVSMTEQQAKYLVLNGQLAEVVVDAKPAAKADKPKAAAVTEPAAPTPAPAKLADKPKA
jgi:hypothetical protein